MVASHLYEIRVEGTVPPHVLLGFDALCISAEPVATVICGPLDQAAMRGLLARLEIYRVELLGIRRAP